MTDEFSPAEKAAVYRAIYERRDMRHFVNKPISNELLQKLLSAAHAAPSVGLMQPWRIIRITDNSLREKIHTVVEQERKKTAAALQEREEEFMRLKVEGVRDCGELLVMALCDRREEYIFGRRTIPEMDMASVACAIQNLWLAARAEGLGMGWVSIFEPEQLGELLSLPEGAMPVAILCLGEVEAFYEKPMLDAEGWAQPNDLEQVLMENGWDEVKGAGAHNL